MTVFETRCYSTGIVGGRVAAAYCHFTNNVKDVHFVDCLHVSKVLLPTGIQALILQWFIGSHESTPIRHECWCSQFQRAHTGQSLQLTMKRERPTSQILFFQKIRTPFNTWFLGFIRVHTPNLMSIGLSIFAGLAISPTHRQFVITYCTNYHRTAHNQNYILYFVNFRALSILKRTDK